MADLKVTQVRSTIGAKPKARGTMRALGLRGIGQSNLLPDRPEIRGMIRKVSHLVTVDEGAGEKAGTSAKAAPKKTASVEEADS
jgi:large subunit ribosomal protein L30